ncbi:MAG: MBL fold metallo-hydrolase [Rhodospirillaceae bacterium]|nr:MBL fold metallo-hydrolase [Rhodospirillaceae bacterium]
MTSDSDFYARFWGVRGSIACPGAETAIYGGNTPCVEIRCGSHLFIFDAGTGLRSLGEFIDKNGIDDVDLFLSHTHVEHIVGLPFFGYAYKTGNALRIWSGHLEDGKTTESVLRQYMADPLFPISIDVFSADVSYHDFKAGETLTLNKDITLRTTMLNHPQNATGYRVEFGGKSICYVTDTEQYEDGPDRNILALIDGADIVIYDSMFTDAEYPDFKGWGHSTWEEGARLCAAANVGTFVVFHHLPERTDADLDVIAGAVDKLRPGSLVAREGMQLAP